ncbi:MAG TPA: sigma-70 family RNA polymerase sigma factor [Acidimicrobiales bacterium]|nr:sigma-70 family RNA polymerase sigma factor [Acidimicrobiales bacterium]
MDVEDRALVARLEAGDDSALREIFERYAGFILGVARRVTGNAPAAEEVLQDVVTALWSRPERFDAARGSLRAYLGVLAQRRAIDAVRAESRRRGREDRFSSLSGIASSSQTVPGWEGGPGAEADVTDAVRRAIARLPTPQRLAVELAFWQGKTHREVAQALGIPEGTAKSRLRLAQRKLADWLAPVGAGSSG